jgi:hypothetical protein
MSQFWICEANVNEAYNPELKVGMILKAENKVKYNKIAYFEEFHQGNFEDILNLTEIRVRTFLNFFQLCLRVIPEYIYIYPLLYK